MQSESVRSSLFTNQYIVDGVVVMVEGREIFIPKRQRVRDRSRYRPHQGAAECARRTRQAAA